MTSIGFSKKDQVGIKLIGAYIIKMTQRIYLLLLSTYHMIIVTEISTVF